MKLPRIAARIAAISLMATAFGLSSPTLASASGPCYSYNYSDWQQIYYDSHTVINESVWFSESFDCYGRALTITVSHIHDYYSVNLSPPAGLTTWHAAHSTQVNRQQYYDVAYDDNWGPSWYNAGWRAKDDYPNVTIPYNSYANTLTGLWQCGVAHAVDCQFRHFFVLRSVQTY